MHPSKPLEPQWTWTKGSIGRAHSKTDTPKNLYRSDDDDDIQIIEVRPIADAKRAWLNQAPRTEHRLEVRTPSGNLRGHGKSDDTVGERRALSSMNFRADNEQQEKQHVRAGNRPTCRAFSDLSRPRGSFLPEGAPKTHKTRPIQTTELPVIPPNDAIKRPNGIYQPNHGPSSRGSSMWEPSSLVPAKRPIPFIEIESSDSDDEVTLPVCLPTSTRPPYTDIRAAEAERAEKEAQRQNSKRLRQHAQKESIVSALTSQITPGVVEQASITSPTTSTISLQEDRVQKSMDEKISSSLPQQRELSNQEEKGVNTTSPKPFDIDSGKKPDADASTVDITLPSHRNDSLLDESPLFVSPSPCEHLCNVTPKWTLGEAVGGVQAGPALDKTASYTPRARQVEVKQTGYADAKVNTELEKSLNENAVEERAGKERTEDEEGEGEKKKQGTKGELKSIQQNPRTSQEPEVVENVSLRQSGLTQMVATSDNYGKWRPRAVSVNSDGGTDCAATFQSSEARQQRIQAKKERNARMQQAEQEAMEQSDEEEGDYESHCPSNIIVTPSKPQGGEFNEPGISERRPPQNNANPTCVSSLGPHALNSDAGLEIITRVNARGVDPTLVPRPLAAISSNQRMRGGLNIEDVKILTWRKSCQRLKEMEALFEQTFGYSKSSKSLSKRFGQVRDVIQKNEIPCHLIDLAFNEDSDALGQINALIIEKSLANGASHKNSEHGKEPAKEHFASSPQVNQAHGNWRPPSQTPHTHPKPPMVRGVSKSESIAENSEYQNGYRPIAGEGPAREPLASNLQVAQVYGDRRPPLHTLNTQLKPPMEGVAIKSESITENSEYQNGHRPIAGKILNSEAIYHYLEMLKEESEAATKAATAAQTREPSPISANDYCHFAYVVERRELSHEEAEDGDEIDDRHWFACGTDYENLAEAEAEAMEEAVRLRAYQRRIVQRKLSVHLDETDQGCLFCETQWMEALTVQVRVRRFMRSYQDGVLPQSKDDWAPKTVYLVKRRVVVTQKDDDDVVVAREVQECDVENSVFTTLELANDRAIREYVATTFRPRSGHLTKREMEVQERQAELAEELQSRGEEEMFDSSAADGKAEVRIWVERAALRGPRNL